LAEATDGFDAACARFLVDLSLLRVDFVGVGEIRRHDAWWTSISLVLPDAQPLA
jgi:hypothetical protein